MQRERDPFLSPRRAALAHVVRFPSAVLHYGGARAQGVSDHAAHAAVAMCHSSRSEGPQNSPLVAAVAAVVAPAAVLLPPRPNAVELFRRR